MMRAWPVLVLGATLGCTSPTQGSKEPGTIAGLDSLRDVILRDERVPDAVKRYVRDDRAVVLLKNLFTDEEYLKPQPFADLDRDGPMDSVLLMPEFVFADSSLTTGNEGQTFVFTSPALGKLSSPEPGCNHIANMFALDDIDEDGIAEVGLYTSSWASRYKALRVFALRSRVWREQASVPFDIFCPEPPAQERIRKVAKGILELRMITTGGRSDTTCSVDEWHRETIR